MTSPHLLPPNASRLERDLASVMANLQALPIAVDTLYDPDRCPAEQLPWLAWAMSVDGWDTTWTVEQKRHAIRQSFYVHRHKGTAGAVRAALSVLEIEAELIEWFQMTPAAAPYTFAVEATLDGHPITDALYSAIIRAVEGAKNVRSHLGRVALVGASQGAIHVGATTVCRDVVTIDCEPLPEP